MDSMRSINRFLLLAFAIANYETINWGAVGQKLVGVAFLAFELLTGRFVFVSKWEGWAVSNKMHKGLK